MQENNQSVLGQTLPLSRVQKLIGRRMLESKRELPCFYLKMTADLTDMNNTRRKLSKALNEKISTNDIFYYSMSRAVAEFPLMAGQIDGDYIQIAKTVNIGFAVAASKGLFVPVIKSANEKTIAQIARESEELTNKARSGILHPDELTGANIALSSLGMFGIDSFIAVLPPGSTSILSIGRLVPTVVPASDGYAIRKLMSINIAVDHKVVNGDYAARFLKRLVEFIENPQLALDNEAPRAQQLVV